MDALGRKASSQLATYIVWGLTLAIQLMVDTSTCRNYRFVVSWMDIAVGTIWFIRTEENDLSAALDYSIDLQSQRRRSTD